MRRFLKEALGTAIIMAAIIMVFIAANVCEVKANTGNCTATVKGVGYNTVTINANTGNYWYSGVAIYRSTSKNSGYKKINPAQIIIK